MVSTLMTRGCAVAAAVACTISVAGPATASAPGNDRPGTVTTFVPPAGTNTPFGITDGPGGVYFAHGATIDRLAHGHITELPLPDPTDANAGWLAWDGHSSSLWFADRGVGAIGTITASGVVTEYAIPAGADDVALPQSLVLGPTDVYFTDQNNDRIGRLDKATQQFTFWSVPTADSTPLGMVRADDGDLYFTERTVDKIGRLDPATGLFTEWSLDAGAFPNRLAVTPDGSVWFTELRTSEVARIDPTGHLHQYPVVGGPVGLVYNRGHLYAAMNTSGQLAEINLQGRVVRTWTLPGAVGVLQVAAGNGEVWVTDGAADHVYRVDLG